MHSCSAAKAREGVVLLVVITLLTLFAVVGITFVIYAQAEAGSMRGARESETLQRPDMDPEALLSFFLNQLIYDTDNPLSALRGQSFARNMYGQPGNTTAFNGTGRIHTNANTAQDDYYKVDYTNYSGGAAPNPAQYGSANPSYTYPDFNSLYLAAVRGSDGAVLIPSYCRANPQGGQPICLRPNNSNNQAGMTNYHPAFAPPEDGQYDVKNRPDSPGVLLNPGQNPPQYSVNDSIWIDCGFPVMRMPDGRKVKPLFAPLIMDLDGLVNVNAHGNALGDIGGSYYSISHQGWSPGEVNPSKVITQGNESSKLLRGNGVVKGRYDQAIWSSFWGGPGWQGHCTEELKYLYAPGGHFWASSDLDCWPPDANPPMYTLPQAGSGFSFPAITNGCTHGWWGRNDNTFNPVLYNYFDPTQNCYWLGSPPAEKSKNRAFAPSHMEALLRYGDRGSPALTSDLFLLCPQNFANAKTRRLVTTLSMDRCVPGVMPCAYDPAGTSSYQLTGGGNVTFPSRPPVAFPAFAGPAPNAGEFGASWSAVGNAATNTRLYNRINLNRGFTDYPLLDQNNQMPVAGYTKALQDRQQMAQDIFNILREVTGSRDPAAVDPVNNKAEYDALRALAQLAVNIVDYVNFPQPQPVPNHPTQVAPDDVMTAFNWNPAKQGDVKNGWVFGTVLPRLVVNEAYAQIDNQQGAAGTATKYDVNCWVELHNTFASDNSQQPDYSQPSSGNQIKGQVGLFPAIPPPLGGTARLYFNGPTSYAGYRVIVAQTVSDDQTKDNGAELLKPENVLGVPVNIQTVIDQYAPDKPTDGTNTLLTKPDDFNQVQPGFQRSPNAGGGIDPSLPYDAGPVGQMLAGQQGSNRGFYVLGPATPLPGTKNGQNFFATLPVKEQPATAANDPTLNLTNPGNVNSSAHYVYTPTTNNPADFSKLNQTVVLQRLACPYLPPQTDPAQIQAKGYFNPYVTVDYMLKTPTYDNVSVDGAGKHTPPANQDQCSYGRNQPYAADITQQVKQKPANAIPGPVQHTFFGINVQNGQGQANAFAYDWLAHMNRPLVSTIEVLQTSGYHPSLITQLFMTQGTNGNGSPVAAGKFQHRAPWFQQNTMIYRALEFFEGGIRPQWSPIGGRFTGKINLNTIWDVETFQALCDAEPTNTFTAAAVNNIWSNLLKSRSPQGAPAPGDRPFLSLAAPFAANGLQYPNPNGAGIDDTILRADPNPPAINPQKRLLEPNPDPNANPQELIAAAGDHPFLRLEFLTKIFNSTTTRSNVFAVWLTVGFFEVLDDTNPNAPPKLGREIGKAEGRQVRHRMFAILDRSNLTLDPASPNSAGPRPFFIDSRTPVVLTNNQPASVTITVPALSGAYEESTWQISAQAPNNTLVVDSGPNQETVTVTAVDAVNLTFSATFTKPHPVGFVISNATPGNPGPQARFDVRNPKFSGLVRYFSIVE